MGSKVFVKLELAKKVILQIGESVTNGATQSSYRKSLKKERGGMLAPPLCTFHQLCVKGGTANLSPPKYLKCSHA